jgi:hypothetical protein
MSSTIEEPELIVLGTCWVCKEPVQYRPGERFNCTVWRQKFTDGVAVEEVMTYQHEDCPPKLE